MSYRRYMASIVLVFLILGAIACTGSVKLESCNMDAPSSEWHPPRDAVQIVYVPKESLDKIADIVFWSHWAEGSGPHGLTMEKFDKETWTITLAALHEIPSESLKGAIQVVFKDGTVSINTNEIVLEPLHEIDVKVLTRKAIE